MPNCSADKGLKAISIRGVSESPSGWSSICNLGHCSRLEHSVQSRRRHAIATKGAQSIQNTCTASNNVVDVIVVIVRLYVRVTPRTDYNTSANVHAVDRSS